MDLPLFFEDPRDLDMNDRMNVGVRCSFIKHCNSRGVPDGMSGDVGLDVVAGLTSRGRSHKN